MPPVRGKGRGGRKSGIAIALSAIDAAKQSERLSEVTADPDENVAAAKKSERVSELTADPDENVDAAKKSERVSELTVDPDENVALDPRDAVLSTVEVSDYRTKAIPISKKDLSFRKEDRPDVPPSLEEDLQSKSFSPMKRNEMLQYEFEGSKYQGKKYAYQFKPFHDYWPESDMKNKINILAFLRYAQKNKRPGTFLLTVNKKTVKNIMRVFNNDFGPELRDAILFEADKIRKELRLKEDPLASRRRSNMTTDLAREIESLETRVKQLTAAFDGCEDEKAELVDINESSQDKAVDLYNTLVRFVNKSVFKEAEEKIGEIKAYDDLPTDTDFEEFVQSVTKRIRALLREKGVDPVSEGGSVQQIVDVSFKEAPVGSNTGVDPSSPVSEAGSVQQIVDVPAKSSDVSFTEAPVGSNTGVDPSSPVSEAGSVQQIADLPAKSSDFPSLSDEVRGLLLGGAPVEHPPTDATLALTRKLQDLADKGEVPTTVQESTSEIQATPESKKQTVLKSPAEERANKLLEQNVAALDVSLQKSKIDFELAKGAEQTKQGQLASPQSPSKARSLNEMKRMYTAKGAQEKTLVFKRNQTFDIALLTNKEPSPFLIKEVKEDLTDQLRKGDLIIKINDFEVTGSEEDKDQLRTNNSRKIQVLRLPENTPAKSPSLLQRMGTGVRAGASSILRAISPSPSPLRQVSSIDANPLKEVIEGFSEQIKTQLNRIKATRTEETYNENPKEERPLQGQRISLESLSRPENFNEQNRLFTTVFQIILRDGLVTEDIYTYVTGLMPLEVIIDCFLRSFEGELTDQKRLLRAYYLMVIGQYFELFNRANYRKDSVLSLAYYKSSKGLEIPESTQALLQLFPENGLKLAELEFNEISGVQNLFKENLDAPIFEVYNLLYDFIAKHVGQIKNEYIPLSKEYVGFIDAFMHDNFAVDEMRLFPTADDFHSFCLATFARCYYSQNNEQRRTQIEEEKSKIKSALVKAYDGGSGINPKIRTNPRGEITRYTFDTNGKYVNETSNHYPALTSGIVYM